MHLETKQTTNFGISFKLLTQNYIYKKIFLDKSFKFTTHDILLHDIVNRNLYIMSVCENLSSVSPHQLSFMLLILHVNFVAALFYLSHSARFLDGIYKIEEVERILTALLPYREGGGDACPPRHMIF